MNFCSHVYSSIFCFSVFEIRSAPPQQLLNETVTFMTPTELSVCKEKEKEKEKTNELVFVCIHTMHPCSCRKHLFQLAG